jgi:hypothetical protein
VCVKDAEFLSEVPEQIDAPYVWVLFQTDKSVSPLFILYISRGAIRSVGT